MDSGYLGSFEIAIVNSINEVGDRNMAEMIWNQAEAGFQSMSAPVV